MAFTVYLDPNDSLVNDPYPDSSTYTISETNGVLHVRRGQTDDGQDSYYSPTGWAYIRADPDHRPGGPKGGQPTYPPRRIR